MDISQNFLKAMSEAGLNFPASNIIADGAIHRFKQDGDKGEPCWYVLHKTINNIVYGVFGCFKRGIDVKYCSKDKRQLTQEERASINTAIQEQQNKIKSERKAYHKEGSSNAIEIWNKTSMASNDHPYLLRKKVKNYGLRLDGDSLIIPLLDNKNNIHGLQSIKPDGTKKFSKGTNKKGHYFVINGTAIKIIVEGYATGASVNEATGYTVYIALDSGNLLSVAQAIAKEHPSDQIIIAADNDLYSKHNIGVEKATEAARSINAKLAIAQFKNIKENDKPSDFNDLAQLAGLEEVKRQIDSADYVKDDEESYILTQSQKLLELTENIELFCDKQGVAYACFSNKGHNEVWPVQNKQFQDWLSSCYWKKYHSVPSKNSLQDALNVIVGKARFDNERQNVYMRVANIGSTIYIDLANENWEVIEVTPDGWKLLKSSPVKFRRTKNMQPLPRPEAGGNINDLWRFINIPKRSRKLVLAFLLECFRINTPFIILVIYGLQGSAKSITQTILRRLIDPSSCNLRSAPKKSEDLLIAAVNNWVVSLDNISHLSANEQDDLCRLSTGGGYGTRTLFKTDDETVLDIKKPAFLNGIDNFVTAQDLIDRCIIIELPVITNTARKTETEIYAEFEQEYSKLFGALLDILAATLKELPNVKLENKPRMADFAILGTALEKAQSWNSGSFLEEYEDNRKESILSAMEHSPVVVAIIKFMQPRPRYEGTYTELYKALNDYKPVMCGWPQSSKGLANQLKRHVHALKLTGLEIEFSPRRKDGYYIYIYKFEDNVHQVHQVHQPSNSKGYGGELMGELGNDHVHKYTQCTPQVHLVTPCKDRENVRDVLGEHKNHTLLGASNGGDVNEM